MKKALLASLFLSFSIHAIASVSFQKIVDANADGDWKSSCGKDCSRSTTSIAVVK